MATAKKETKVTEVQEAESLAAKIIEDAKRQAAEILRKAEEDTKKTVQEDVLDQTATVQNEKPAADPGDELVEIELFKDGDRYKDDVFVSVNGERCLIKRGVRVKVKRKFAAALEDAARQDRRAADIQLKYERECQDKAHKYGIDV